MRQIGRTFRNKDLGLRSLEKNLRLGKFSESPVWCEYLPLHQEKMTCLPALSDATIGYVGLSNAGRQVIFS
jgi:hypothetical protein